MDFAGLPHDRFDRRVEAQHVRPRCGVGQGGSGSIAQVVALRRKGKQRSRRIGRDNGDRTDSGWPLRIDLVEHDQSQESGLHRRIENDLEGSLRRPFMHSEALEAAGGVRVGRDLQGDARRPPACVRALSRLRHQT